MCIRTTPTHPSECFSLNKSIRSSFFIRVFFCNFCSEHNHFLNKLDKSSGIKCCSCFVLVLEILSRGPLHMHHGEFPPGFPMCFSDRQTGGSNENKYHSFREFNQEKEKTWRAGSESAPPPLPKAAACPWGEEASNPICKRRKCGWEKGESRPLENWSSHCSTEERGW